MKIENYTKEELDAAIQSAHPLNTGRHNLYVLAMKMVEDRHFKGDLVELVNYLLTRIKEQDDHF